MPSRFYSSIFPVLVGSALFLVGCARDLTQLEPAPFPAESAVFLDGFGPGVDFQAFAGSKVDALSLDAAVKRSGTTSLRVSVPGPGDASGGFAGGAFVTNVPRDLTGFTALTFWARASTNATLNVAGLGNDNTGTSRYPAEVSGLPLTTTWTKYIIPMPLAAKLSRERGAFFFAEGAEGAAGYEIWFDDIQFEDVPVGSPRPAIGTTTIASSVGAEVSLPGTVVGYTIGGGDLVVNAAPAYFTAISDNPAVAAVSGEGAVSVVGEGSAQVTALLGTTPADGVVTINVGAGPQSAAPAPTRDPGMVISIFSDAYTDVPMSFFEADFDPATVTDVQIAGDNVKRYDNLTFAVMEIAPPRLDASAMTGFHMDVFTDAAPFRIKLVDFGADGAFAGGDDSEFELSFDPATSPALTVGGWSSLDIPLSAFTGLTGKAHISQVIISGGSATTYVDNIYFFSDVVPTGPQSAAPAPTRDPGMVISIFSDAYTDVPMSFFEADFDPATVTDVQIAGDNVKRYDNLTFAVMEIAPPRLDASAMIGFHMDVFTDAAPFRIKLVDFGADGAFAGGDDSEFELSFDPATSPALTVGGWSSLDIPLSAFTGLTGKAHISQVVISGGSPTTYVDNIYFFTDVVPTAPTVAAPAPTLAAADVISLFSDAYPDVPVDTWSTVWDVTELADVQVAGNATKLYTNLVFAGIETIGTPVNATAMTHFRMDIWTPNPTAAPAVFKVKLVDLGANGAFGGGDDVEHEVVLSASTNPAIRTGQWVTLDIPFSAFTGLVTRGALGQLIISGDLSTVYVDNVLLHR